MTARPRPRFRCLEYRFTVEARDAALGAGEDGDAATIVIRNEAACRPYCIDVDGRTVGSAPTAHDVVELFAWYVNRASVERSGDRYLILHAAAVATGGRGVVIAGASGSGKSTLAAALVARGASYLGDEATGLDPERRVLVSNPKPLGLDAAGRSALSSSVAATKDRDSFPLVAPAAIGAWVPAGTTVTPALVVQPEFERESSLEVSDLRVSVNLLRASDGASLWADSFDMNAADIFAIQDKVAQQVATRLQLRFESEEQAGSNSKYPTNPIAYEFYIKGIFSLDERGYDKDAKPQMETTIDFFKKASEADRREE